MISLSPAYGMTIDIADHTLAIAPTPDPDSLDGPQPDPIVVPYGDILDPVVGPLTSTEVGRMDAETLAWAGVDEAGRPVSGTARLDAEIGEDGRSIVLGWRVEVDPTTG
jgi:hypothetical protein